MKHSQFFGPLTVSNLKTRVVNVPFYQAQNLLLQIKYDVQFGDGWYSDTSAEVAAVAVRWLHQIEDMDDMDFGRWVDLLKEFG